MQTRTGGKKVNIRLDLNHLNIFRITQRLLQVRAPLTHQLLPLVLTLVFVPDHLLGPAPQVSVDNQHPLAGGSKPSARVAVILLLPSPGAVDDSMIRLPLC